MRNSIFVKALITMSLVLLTVSSAFASVAVDVPEINPGQLSSLITLTAGGLLILKSKIGRK